MEELESVNILCPVCKKVYKIEISKEIIEGVSGFPFPIIAMHASEEIGKIHTLLVYLDESLKCRHIEHIDKRVFITPYIIYNPCLLNVYCHK
ncbi:MAG: hypothetical protein APG12_00789 [Candidatus Methanofastidiosum methylothiophilum]|uniref:Uncharacterized protein n=1 Tax=Candidatus Methanofastidiosum methylothiophilum TaxID=1705564 RepID=A0A150ILE6_9EURY|nr:MAG: hypothetical protein APG10_00517 [Candidatus Methanofastidiosum methylthiophilus]KYC48066.1 MAG: hypothetical protein APG11_00636 [Candidatus Methanofastidiosum methylthiophilus]KYC50457.1 MAG: hypothetical protein APG12_00789 [Candidatus Methanofastidiosum methylthiophilus]